MKGEVAGSVVLGVTPGWAACGWALVRLTPDGDGVLQAGVIRTRSAYRSADSVTADMMRRGRMLSAQLRVVAQREQLVAIVRLDGGLAEELDHRVYGSLDALALELNVPTYEEAHIARSTALVSARCGMERLVELLDDDEVTEALRGRAIEAVALVLTAADREPKLIESRGLIRRAGRET